MQPTIYFASDHAGYKLKNELVGYVRDTLGYEVIDCGADIYDAEDDFTDFVAIAAREVSANPDTAKAIILGGTGQGEAMLANRFHDVRAAVYYGGPEEIVCLSREHNDANVLSLGARFIESEQAKKIVALWLETPHALVKKYDRRIDEIEQFSHTEVNELRTDVLIRSLVPSLPAQTFNEISALFDSLAGVAQEVQIDIVDGVFAPHTSWPFTEPDIEVALQQLSVYTNAFQLEIDCMCMNPQKYLDTFASLGVGRVVIHADSTDKYDECIAHAKKHGYRIGLGIRNDTSPQLLGSHVHEIDFVQVMGIENIGVQGQVFDTHTLNTVATIRKMYPSLEIAVDGAVNATTIPLLLKAGANRFAPGSAIVKAKDVSVAYKQLAGMIGL